MNIGIWLAPIDIEGRQAVAVFSSQVDVNIADCLRTEKKRVLNFPLLN